MARLSPRILALILCLFAMCEAEAGRRGLRIDFGAWYPPVAIVPYQGVATEGCPGASVNGSPYNPPLHHHGAIGINPLYFQTATFYDLVLTEFYCQHSRPYQAFADPGTYLNETTLPSDEQGLAGMIGANTNNAVTASRYSFLGQNANGYFGRQWAFYFFPEGLMVVALYGVPDDGSTGPYESILDLSEPVDWLLWDSDRDGYTGQYWCFQDLEYIGDCVPPEPEPPEMLHLDGFE